MKTFSKFLFLLVFVWLSPLFIFLVSLRLSGYSGDLLKKQLIQGNVYSQLVDSLNTKINETMEKGEADDPLRLLGPVLKREVTASYAQKKTERLFDDTSQWLSGSGGAPALSFFDLKDRIFKQNPQLLSEVTTLSRELRKKSEFEDREGTSLALEKILKSDFSLPLGPSLGWLKTVHFFATKGLIIVASTLILLVMSILILNDTRSSRFRWLGLTFFLSFLWNLPLWLVFFVTSWGVSSLISQVTPDMPALAAPLVKILLTPFVSSSIRIGALALGAFFFSSIACFVFATKREH